MSSRSEVASSPPRRFSPRRVAYRVLCGGIVVYGVLVVCLLWLETSLVFQPLRYPHGDWEVELPVEDAWFQADDGVRLHGWYLPHPQARAVILFFHGNAGNLTHRRWTLEHLHRQRASVLLFDYRGYGRSEGSPSESGVLADGRAAREWLAQRAGVEPEQIVLMGESLGCGVAVTLAAEHPARALILEGSFTSLPDVAAEHYPIFPVRWLMRTRLDALRCIAQHHGPLLQIHAQRDEIIPVKLAEQLHAAANTPKRLVVLSGLTHNDLYWQHPDYHDVLDQFLSALP